MSELNDKPITGEDPSPQPRPHRTVRSRLRRFFLRHLPLAIASIVVFLAVLAVGLYFVASSSAFENVVRTRLIAELEELTGGRAEIASFHWRLLHFEAEADGVVIHGLEDPGEAPYARIERLRVVLSLRNLFSPSVRLRSLEIDRPSLPLHRLSQRIHESAASAPAAATSSSSAMDTLFEMHAGSITVEQGNFHYDCRNANFDYQNRNAPLDFSANDASLVMRYVSATFRTPASYRIEAGVTDLNFARTVPRNPLPVHGALQATLDLERAQVFLRSLRITAERRGGPSTLLRSPETSRTLRIPTGTRMSWAISTCGSSTPSPDIADAPDGLAHLDLTAAGRQNAFQIDGGIHVDGGSYIGAGVTATGFTLDTRVHADSKQLLLTGIVARLHQGGQIEGTVALEPWLPSDPSAHLAADFSRN